MVFWTWNGRLRCYATSLLARHRKPPRTSSDPLLRIERCDKCNGGICHYSGSAAFRRHRISLVIIPARRASLAGRCPSLGRPSTHGSDGNVGDHNHLPRWIAPAPSLFPGPRRPKFKVGQGDALALSPAVERRAP